MLLIFSTNSSGAYSQINSLTWVSIVIGLPSSSLKPDAANIHGVCVIWPQSNSKVIYEITTSYIDSLHFSIDQLGC